MLAASFGAATYGPYGPPFHDPVLQATYDVQVEKLASNPLISTGIAQDLVGTVINSALAAGDAMVPGITAKVKAAVQSEIPTIEKKAGGAAAGAVTWLLIGFGAVAVLGAGVWAFTRD